MNNIFVIPLARMNICQSFPSWPWIHGTSSHLKYYTAQLSSSNPLLPCSQLKHNEVFLEMWALWFQSAMLQFMPQFIWKSSACHAVCEVYTGLHLTLGITLSKLPYMPITRTGCDCNTSCSALSSSIDGSHTDVVYQPRAQTILSIHIVASRHVIWSLYNPALSWKAHLHMEGRGEEREREGKTEGGTEGEKGGEGQRYRRMEREGRRERWRKRIGESTQLWRLLQETLKRREWAEFQQAYIFVATKYHN